MTIYGTPWRTGILRRSHCRELGTTKCTFVFRGVTRPAAASRQASKALMAGNRSAGADRGAKFAGGEADEDLETASEGLDDAPERADPHVLLRFKARQGGLANAEPAGKLHLGQTQAPTQLAQQESGEEGLASGFRPGARFGRHGGPKVRELPSHGSRPSFLSCLR